MRTDVAATVASLVCNPQRRYSNVKQAVGTVRAHSPVSLGSTFVEVRTTYFTTSRHTQTRTMLYVRTYVEPVPEATAPLLTLFRLLPRRRTAFTRLLRVFKLQDSRVRLSEQRQSCEWTGVCFVVFVFVYFMFVIRRQHAEQSLTALISYIEFMSSGSCKLPGIQEFAQLQSFV